MNTNYSLNELPEIAKQVISSAKYRVLLFNGQMGVGKTTLIKEICNQLGVNDVTHSPTFSLVNEYESNTGQLIYHFDFYRIEDESEAYDIGIEDYLYSENWCLIEWSENIKNFLPLETVSINLSLTDDGKRNIQLK